MGFLEFITNLPTAQGSQLACIGLLIHQVSGQGERKATVDVRQMKKGWEPVMDVSRSR